MAINNPYTLSRARARQQLALISYAVDNNLAHSWYVHAVSWVNALLAERLIYDDINASVTARGIASERVAPSLGHDPRLTNRKAVAAPPR